jgi:hypothetical protein
MSAAHFDLSGSGAVHSYDPRLAEVEESKDRSGDHSPLLWRHLPRIEPHACCRFDDSPRIHDLAAKGVLPLRKTRRYGVLQKRPAALGDFELDVGADVDGFSGGSR